MSLLQTQAKPILLLLIQGQQAILTKKSQSTLASWIAMFTIVAEFLGNKETSVAISVKNRVFFYNHKIPPPSMKIWVGYYERQKWVSIWTHTTVPIKSEDNVLKKGNLGIDLPNTQSTTVVIGKVYIHVLSSDVASIVRKAEITGNGRKMLYRVHPIRKTPLSWPPPLKMDDRSADAIASALSERSRRTIVGISAGLS